MFGLFKLEALKEAILKRQAEKIYIQGELEESIKRDELFLSSFNTAPKRSRRDLEQSWPGYSPKPSPERDFLDNYSVDGSARELSIIKSTLPGPTEIQRNICNIFWKSSLTFNPYQYGDALISFGSLWPEEDSLTSLLLDAYRTTYLRRSVLELCKLTLRCGPVRVVKCLIDNNIIGLNQRFDNGSTMLHTACVAANREAVAYLYSAGVDTRTIDHQGRTADQVCFNPQVKRILPQNSSPKGAPKPNPEPADKVHKYPWNMLVPDGYYAPDAMARYSLREKPKKYKPTLFEVSVIFEQATDPKQFDDLFNKLQTYQFDVNEEQDDNGDFLMHVAVREGLGQIATVICLSKLFHADYDLKNESGYTCLHIAAQAGCAILADVLLSTIGVDPDIETPDTGWTPLHYACLYNNVDVASVLVKRGADFNIEDVDGSRPDDIARRMGSVDCLELICVRRMQRMEELTSKIGQNNLASNQLRNTDLYVTDHHGNTLIMTAALFDRCRILKTLLYKKNAPVNAQHEKTLRTALSYAAEAGYVDTIILLLGSGANPSIKDIDGLLPLHHSVSNGHKNATDIILRTANSFTGLRKASSLAQSTEVHKQIQVAIARRQRELVTPTLLECAMTGDAGRLYCLLEEGDNVNIMSGVGQWPLYHAVENGHLEVVKLLCENGADLHMVHPQTGNTVLHLSCARGLYDITRYLLNRVKPCLNSHKRYPAADHIVNLPNGLGKVPLVIAAEHGYSKIIKLLLSHGASTSVTDPTGALYNCSEFQGCQVLIEVHRKAHQKALWEAIRSKWGADALRGIFMDKFDHHLRDSAGNTPLMYACQYEKKQAIKYLLQSAVYDSALSRKQSHSSLNSSYDSGACLDTTTTGFSTGMNPYLNGDDLNEANMNKSDNIQTSSHEQCPVPVKFDIESAHEVEEIKTDVKIQDVQLNPVPLLSEHLENKPREKDSVDLEIEKIKQQLKELDSRPKPRKPSRDYDLPPEQDFETNIKDNVSVLFESISCVSKGCIYISENQISHLCAVNTRDGATCYHRLIEAGDNLTILNMLLDADQSAINVQDLNGLSPLHLACKLGRRKTVEKLMKLPFMDINSRTLDGKLPEEMTKDKAITKLIKGTRENVTVPPSSGIFSLPSSIFGGSYEGDSENSIDFDTLNTRFVSMKQQLGPTMYYNEMFAT